MSRRLVDGKLPVPRKGANKGGRPKLLELKPEIIEEACRVLRMGAPADTAFLFCGVSNEVLRNWVIKGHEEPDSIYGALLNRVRQAIAEWELRDISVIERHSLGSPATYEMEVVKDENNRVVRDENGKPIMQVARDANGNPILKTAEVKSDWRAAVTRLERRKPRYWAAREAEGHEAILSFDNKKPETKEAVSFEQRIAQSVDKLEEDV